MFRVLTIKWSLHRKRKIRYLDDMKNAKTEEEKEQTEKMSRFMGMKIGEIMTGNDREYIKEKFSESALDGATALAEWTKKTLFRNNGKHLKAN